MTNSQTQTPTGVMVDIDTGRLDTTRALNESLMERVLESGNVKRAWQQVKHNHGSPGVDGMKSKKLGWRNSSWKFELTFIDIDELIRQ